jgi:hypothetical protein
MQYYFPTHHKAENTLHLMTVPGLADSLAVTIGNAYLIPADESNADKPWKILKIDIDGKDCLFICKDAVEPQHIQNIVPADIFDAVGVRYLFRHSPPPADFCQMLVSRGYMLLQPQPKETSK